MNEELLQHLDLSLPQHQRTLDRHNAALERIAQEQKEQEQRSAKLVARLEEERKARLMCGTASGYNRHRRKKEKACQPCVAANREANRKKDAQRRAKKRAEKEGRVKVLKPCGTSAAAKRHQRNGEPLCDACQEARRQVFADLKEQRRQEREASKVVPSGERTECCGAPVDAVERTQKYVGIHRKEGTVPCRPAKECRNAVDRKIYKARKCVDDVNERRRERRAG